VAGVDAKRVLLNGGKLSYGCTNLALAWPHGGTGLGLVAGIEFRPPSGHKILTAEETNAAATVLWTGGDAVLGLLIEGWDVDALSKFFPNSATSSGDRIMSWPGSTLPVGAPFTPLAPLVFTPTDSLAAAASRPAGSITPALILYSAVPLLDLNAALRSSARSYLTIPALAIGLPDAQDRVAQMGPIGKLTL
jgi:hypothetical protein